MTLIDTKTALDRLYALTGEFVQQGVSLVPRVVTGDTPFVQYQHYPKGDCIAPASQSRWFYHAHKPAEREPGEHGHFHMFLPLSLFEGEEPLIAPPEKNAAGKKIAKVVHFGALNFGTDGMPLSWFTVNYWVTFEYMMRAEAIAERLHHFDMTDAPGDPLVNEWLTCAVHACHDQIVDLLHQRDAVLADGQYKDHSIEITSRGEFNL